MPDPLVHAQSNGPARRITPLETLSPHAQGVFLKLGYKKKYRNGQVVLSRGQAAPSALLLLSGRLRTVTTTSDGEEHLIRWLEPGEITGLSSVISDSPFPADLIATGATELLQVDRQTLINLIQTDGTTALAIVQVLSMRVSQLLDVIADYSLPKLEHKVLAALERLALYHGISVKDGTELRVNQSDIAQVVAASRQRVNIQLQRLQELKFIRLGYGSITLLKKKN
ncbi:MAG: cAMP-activated global transcriptional regulator [Pseudomonadota bacterium]|jgi:CRP/FNR family transcriptional regulator, cyclic AMP receptor protein